MFQQIFKQFHQTFSGFSPLASIDNREAWEGLDSRLREQLIRDGEQFLHYSYPILLITDYMEFSRTGNRTHFEDKQFARRTVLNSLVLAECAEHKGRFIDDILNGIYAICEETAWQLPAHNSYVRDHTQFPLPDVTHPIIDLFQAETGAILAAVMYVMKSELDAISPFISIMIKEQLEHRIFTPYLTEHFWWMGDGNTPMNNWTVWCTQNILLTAALSNLDNKRQREIFQKACESIDYFLEEYGEDGCCDEGAQYYRHAGLCLFNCIEILNAVTDGCFTSVYQVKKIQNIASYIRNVHVKDQYYINFSDCSPVAGRCNAREFLFGKRTGDTLLLQLAAQDYENSGDPLLTKEHNLFYRLQTIFQHKEMLEYSANSQINPPDLYYPSVGLFLARDNQFCLAVKAGDNNDSHNHNDTGSFTIYKNGTPLFIDIGVESYTKKTFSPQRYEIWTMQSQYHNLPTFLGDNPKDANAFPYAYIPLFAETKSAASMQMNGSVYAAKKIQYQFSETLAQISMDIADAYPDSRVHLYFRTVVLKKNSCITIQDHCECEELQAVLSLITYEQPFWNTAVSTLSIGELGICQIQGTSLITIEQLPITNKRLQTAWKHNIWRTLVYFQNQDLILTII